MYYALEAESLDKAIDKLHLCLAVELGNVKRLEVSLVSVSFVSLVTCLYRFNVEKPKVKVIDKLLTKLLYLTSIVWRRRVR